MSRDVHLYKKISTRCYIALTAIDKVHIGSPKMARNKLILRIPKVTWEVNFPKYLWGCCAREGEDCSCASILLFFSAASGTTTIEHQIQSRLFSSFFRRLRKDSVTNYGSIWTQFPPPVRRRDVLCKALNVS